MTAPPPHESGLMISRNWRDIRADDRRIRVFLPCQRWHVRPIISVPPEETADWYADAFQDTGSAGGIVLTGWYGCSGSRTVRLLIPLAVFCRLAQAWTGACGLQFLKGGE